MSEVTQADRSVLRIDLVTADKTTDITQFVSAVNYGYSTTPPWDTVDVTVQVPLHLVDKIFPGTPVQIGEIGSFVRRQEPGFWVIIWLEDWPRSRSPTAMGVGYVDVLSGGEQDIASISAQAVKGSMPIQLSCTGMLALAGKSNVRLTMSGEQNTTGFLYDLASFKSAVTANLQNLTSKEVGVTLDAIWKDTIKVRAPWGQAGRRAPLLSLGAGVVAAPAGAPGAPVGTFSELGTEMPVAYNKRTFIDYAQTRSNLCRPVYGARLLNVPAMWPDASLWQWLNAMMVPSTDVVELFATMDPFAAPSPRKGESVSSTPLVTTALGRSLGNAQPVLCYRFKPFALKAINLANIQKQTNTGADAKTQIAPMAEQLGLFQDDLLPRHSAWMGDYYRLRDTDIFQYSFSYNDAKRVNLVFATPAVIAGTSVVKPFSQVGNVVIPDRAQFAHHGMRAFEVAWPYLAVQDLRETVTFNAATASQTVANDPTKIQEYAWNTLNQIKEDWESVFGSWNTPSASMSGLWDGGETAVLAGVISKTTLTTKWKAWREVTIPQKMPEPNTQTITMAVEQITQSVRALVEMEQRNPRYFIEQWAMANQLKQLHISVQSALTFRRRQKVLIGQQDWMALRTLYSENGYTGGMGTEDLAVAGSKTNYTLVDEMLYLLIKALEVDLDNLMDMLVAYQKLLVAKGTVPVTAVATVTGGGGSVAAAGAFKAEPTLVSEFSALNELLWSIVGEGERFADMTMVIRGRPLIRQGYFIECDLGQKPSVDTVYRYCTGYIENVNHSFRIDEATNKWESQTTLQLSRVWFSQNPGEYYTPLAASSLGNQTKSEQPNRVMRGRNAGSQNSPTPGKPTLWDLSEWSKLRTAYDLPEAQTANRLTSDDWKIRCFVVHHTFGATPRAALNAWGLKNKKKASSDAAETAAHALIDTDGSVYQLYDPYTAILNHTVSRLAKPKGDSQLPVKYVRSMSVGFDLVGNMQVQHPEPVQEHSARLYMRTIADKVGIQLRALELPKSVRDGAKTSRMSDLVTTDAVLKEGFTVFGHCSWDQTECPARNTRIEALTKEPGFVFGSADNPASDEFTVIKVNDLNYKEHVGFLRGRFPKVTDW